MMSGRSVHPGQTGLGLVHFVRRCVNEVRRLSERRTTPGWPGWASIRWPSSKKLSDEYLWMFSLKPKLLSSYGGHTWTSRDRKEIRH
jgi:hypothetical protein